MQCTWHSCCWLFTRENLWGLSQHRSSWCANMSWQYEYCHVPADFEHGNQLPVADRFFPLAADKVELMLRSLPFVERVQQHITSFQPIDISADGHVICVSDTAETIYVKKTWVVPVSIMLYATVLDEQVYLQAFDEKSTLRWAFRYPALENMQLSALAQKCKDFMVARDTMSALAPVLFVGSRNGEILTGRYGVITADFWQTTCNKTMSHRG